MGRKFTPLMDDKNLQVQESRARSERRGFSSARISGMTPLLGLYHPINHPRKGVFPLPKNPNRSCSLSPGCRPGPAHRAGQRPSLRALGPGFFCRGWPFGRSAPLSPCCLRPARWRRVCRGSLPSVGPLPSLVPVGRSFGFGGRSARSRRCRWLGRSAPALNRGG